MVQRLQTTLPAPKPWSRELYAFLKAAMWISVEFLPYGFLRSSEVNESSCNGGVLGSVPGSGVSPGEEMATHSSIRAWEIPWTEEPGGLQLVIV